MQPLVEYLATYYVSGIPDRSARLPGTLADTPPSQGHGRAFFLLNLPHLHNCAKSHADEVGKAVSMSHLPLQV